MVAGTIRVLVVLVLVMGVAGPVAAGEQTAVVAGAGVTALEAGEAQNAVDALAVEVGAETGAGVASLSVRQEFLAAISEQAGMVSASGLHSCALTTSGGVKCWGWNEYGQLGDGTTTNRNTPMHVQGLSSGVAAVSAGFFHTCALTTAGGVKCWGRNDYGQLGNGGWANSTTPMDVVGLSSGVASISGGVFHTCAVTTGGGVKCWGGNGSGQLGDGTTTNSNVPVNVVGLSSGVAKVAAGYHTCALTTAGGVKCWGRNDYGQLGDGTTTNSNVPVDVVGLGSGVTAIAAGGYHTCAVAVGGGVKCWGRNAYGELGDGTTTNSSTPVGVAGLSSGAIAVSTGNGSPESHSCALTVVGGVRCWGDNGRGQLGDGTRGGIHTTFVDVVGLSGDTTAITTGGYHTCALTTGGGVKCWGYNYYGQLGSGAATTMSTTPVDVVSLASGTAAVSAGYRHNCALTAVGGVRCWGSNEYGQLGDGTTYKHSTPLDVVGLSSGAANIDAGTSHSCAVTTSGGVKCWGYNSSGQLGNGTYGYSPNSTPVDVVGLSGGVAAVSAAGIHTCAVTTGGGVKCWGANYYGQLGDGTTTTSYTPVDVVGLSSGVALVSTGALHTCAVTTGGGAKCWGYNSAGQLGDGTTTEHWTPVDVVGLSSGVASVSAGSFHTCAVSAGGGVKCWGGNGFGELGNGTTTSSSTPVDVVGLSSGVATVSAGYLHTCALTTSGGVKCWGANWDGQLGDGTTSSSTTPVDVVGLSGGVVAGSAGGGNDGSHTCILTAGGGVKCWGSNYSDQLGDLADGIPVDVLGLEGSIYTTIAKSGVNVVLAWLHMISAVDHYEVYRSTTTPYFEPGSLDAVKLSPEPPAPSETPTEVTFTDAGVLGSSGSYFYAVVPVNEGGEFYATSNRTGAFNYGMTPGSGLRRQ